MKRAARWVGVLLAVVVVFYAAVFWAMERPRGGDNGALASHVDCTWWKGEQVGVQGVDSSGDRVELLTTTVDGDARAILTNQRELRSRWIGDTFTASFVDVSDREVLGLFADEQGRVRVSARAEATADGWRVTSFAECQSYFDD